MTSYLTVPSGIGSLGFGAITVTNEEKIIAGIPGLRTWLRPEIKRIEQTASALSLYDMRNNDNRFDSYKHPSFSGNPIIIPVQSESDALLNNKPSITRVSDFYNLLRPLSTPPITVPSTDALFVVVCHPTHTALNCLIGNLGPAVGDHTPLIRFNAATISSVLNHQVPQVHTNAGVVRVIANTVPAVDFRNQTSILGVLFSTTRGVRLFKNGAEIAANAADLNGLSHTQWQLYGLANGGASQQYIGKHADVMTFGVDLTAPANRGYWNKLHSLLGTRYNVVVSAL